MEEEDSGAPDMTGATILVCWTSLLLLLTKCRHEACAALVSPNNMKLSMKGNVLGYIEKL